MAFNWTYDLYLFSTANPTHEIDIDKLSSILKSQGFESLETPQKFIFVDETEIVQVHAQLMHEYQRLPVDEETDMYYYILFKLITGPNPDEFGVFLDKAFALKYELGLDIYDNQARILVSANTVPFAKQHYDIYRKYHRKAQGIFISEYLKELDKIQENQGEQDSIKRDNESQRQFLYDYSIRIPGIVETSGENTVFVKNINIPLSDAPFTILLRLIIELEKGGNGFLHIGDLIQERYLTESGAHQGISRLKKPFRLRLDSFIDGFKIDKLFQRIPQHIRLSSNPDKIVVNKAKLLEHINPAIAKLAEQFKN